jgi:hypothetical protein
MSRHDDLWAPLVDEPIGPIVEQLQAEHPEIGGLVTGPQAILAFRMFARIRVGLVLGRLLVENDVPDYDGTETWIEALLRDPGAKEAVVRELRALAEEIAADPRYRVGEPPGPDEAARERFREFARRQLG